MLFLILAIIFVPFQAWASRLWMPCFAEVNMKSNVLRNINAHIAVSVDNGSEVPPYDNGPQEWHFAVAVV